jgi:uncharacterized membrane protein YeaQ/YmgE (transglycosylase-associated protein family)
MAAQEGLHRIRLVGKAVLVLGLFLDAIALIGCLTASLFHESPWTNFAPFGIILSMIGAAILLAAWIIEGFALPPQPPHE